MNDDDALREEIITFLIETRSPNPKWVKLTNRALFAYDNRRQIEEMLAFERAKKV